MKSVLVGNGINIQFGGKTYSSSFIMKRIINNVRLNRYLKLFDKKILPEQLEIIFKAFKDIANDILRGKYDYLKKKDDLEAIIDFKSRYKVPIRKYYEIMLEDWFLLIRLFFVEYYDLESQWQSVKQGFERMVLDGIYNEGMIQNIYKNMNKNVKEFFTKFDYIFSLNYDNNIELLTNRDVMHLHGDYSVLADSENPCTVQGYIRQQQKKLVLIKEFKHCFCNALLDYSGELKYKYAETIQNIATQMNSLLELWRSDKTEYNNQIQPFKDKYQPCLHYINTYIENPTLKIGTNYHFNDLCNLKGELHIIGMSPSNDSHIFRCINESDIEFIKFYCYDESSITIPINKPYKIESVQKLWETLDAKNKKYRFNYINVNDDRIDAIFEISNKLSFDPISKEDIVHEVNSIPQFKIDYLCKLVKREFIKQKKKVNPKNQEELSQNFKEISRIALREGILPSALYLIYIMNGE